MEVPHERGIFKIIQLLNHDTKVKIEEIKLHLNTIIYTIMSFKANLDIFYALTIYANMHLCNPFF